MKVYISGGAKNGKSTLAQKLAVLCARYEKVLVGADGEPTGKEPRENELPLYYIATMIPTDEEDRARIARHIGEREGLGFTTVEREKNISGITPNKEDRGESVGNSASCGEKSCGCDPQGVFLLDSVTALLANVMFPPSAAAGNEGYDDTVTDDVSESGNAWFNPDAAEEVAEDLKTFFENVENAILVSDYIYADPLRRANPEGDGMDYTDTYIRGLAYIDRTIAALCDEVYEVSAGMVI